MSTSETLRVERERQYSSNKLVAESFLAEEVLMKAIEKERRILEMAMDIGFPLKSWRALTNIAAKTREGAYDRAKSEFESFEMEYK